MATLEEKQAELDALQAAFDDYIASSRELEEELEAELSKCREFCALHFAVWILPSLYSSHIPIAFVRWIDSFISLVLTWW